MKMEINKNYVLPEKCMRGIECQPLALIVDAGNGFLCCGLNTEREVDIDIFTHCFKNESTDTRFDMSKEDLLSSISIFSMAMSIQLALTEGKSHEKR